jgi:lipopolysaccharide heptosyltransferase II
MDSFDEYCDPKLEIVKGEQYLRGSINKILVVQLGDIGDLVLAIPTIRSLKESYPSALIYVAAREKACELVDLCAWADGVIKVQKEKRPALDAIRYNINFFRYLRSLHFDLVFDMRTGTRGAFLAYLSGARIRLGYRALDDVWRNVFFPHLVFPPMDMPKLHMAHYHLLLLAAYGLRVNPAWPELLIDDHRSEQISQLLLTEKIPIHLPLIAIQPFSLWHYKEWSAEKFAKLSTWIHKKYGFSVLICGNISEHERVQRMINCGKNGGLYNLAGKTSIAEYAALLSRCSLFIGCDSAGVHIAAAVNTATATIYGPSSPAAWAPRGPRHQVIQKTMDCVPCRQKGCDNTEQCRCLDTLSLDEVIQKIEPFLDSCVSEDGVISCGQKTVEKAQQIPPRTEKQRE